MNRRELAKTGFLAICGALVGKAKKPTLEPSEPVVAFTVRNYSCKPGGKWKVVTSDVFQVETKS